MVQAAGGNVSVEEQDASEVEGTTSFRLDSGNGLVIQVISYGATLLSCQFKSKTGQIQEVTLNRQNFADLCSREKNPYYGATIGRVAGRIGGAKFTIGETEYRIEANNGEACLHGGTHGFDRKEWDAEIVHGKALSDFTTVPADVQDVTGFSGVKFTRTSPDLEQEFPGTVHATSWFLINAANKMIMAWEAVTPDQDVQTPINMTNHAYWNLSGDFSDGTIAQHKLKLNCSNVLPMSAGLIPTGEFLPVAETPYDFVGDFSAIGDKERLTGAIDGGGQPGIDHAFVVDRADGIDSMAFVEAGCLRHEASGRQMKVLTTQQATVVYTSNFIPAGDADGPHR